MSYFELIDVKNSVSEKEQPVKLVVGENWIVHKATLWF